MINFNIFFVMYIFEILSSNYVEICSALLVIIFTPPCHGCPLLVNLGTSFTHIAEGRGSTEMSLEVGWWGRCRGTC